MKSEDSSAVSDDPDQSQAQSKTVAFLDSTIFYGALILIVLIAIPYGTVEAWSQAVLECAIFLLGLLWVVEGFLTGAKGKGEKGKKGKGKGNIRIFYPMIVFVIFASVQSLRLWQQDWAGTRVSVALSSDPFETWAFVLRTSALILAGVLLVHFTTTRRRLGVLVHAIIGVAVLCALFGIARQTMQRAPGFILPLLKPGLGYAQFINKNHFAFLMEMSIGLVIGLIAMRSERRERIPLYLSALLAMVAGLVLCKSRGGLLAFIAQVFCTGLLLMYSSSRGAEVGRIRRWSRTLAARAVMTVALLFVVIAGVAWLASDQLPTVVETAALEMYAPDQNELHEGARRRDIWRTSWMIFKAHPLAGAGLGGYWAEVPTFHNASGSLTPQQAHNDYLELLASAGIVGVALLVWFAIVLCKQARRSVSAGKGFQRAVALGSIVGLVGIGVHSIVDFGLHTTINALVFMALLAILSLDPLPRRLS